MERETWRKDGRTGYFLTDKNRADNELYTTEAAVGKILLEPSFFAHLMSDTQFICPFDGDDSNIVKVLRRTKSTVLNNIIDGQYVLYEDLPDSHFEGRVMVTNPPFDGKHHARKLMERVDEAYLVVPHLTAHRIFKGPTPKWCKDYDINLLSNIYKFHTPSGVDRNVHCAWLHVKKK